MSEPTVFDRIRSDVGENDVFLYMKGTPVFPQCGFSAAVVQVLTNLGVRFSSANVLEDPELREGIKRFSSWPTVPQLYVKGEFVGGCDIVREMYETGELIELFNSRGVPVQLANPA
jgi:monothiol glutaredoxin